MIDPLRHYLKPVRVLTDRYLDHDIGIGALGVVVEVWGDGFYEVEFSNPATGETIALMTLPEHELELANRVDVAPKARNGG